MKKLVVLLGIVLVLFLVPTIAVAPASASDVELLWKGHNVHISVLVHRFRPSSTSGWATEEFASLEHFAGFSVGDVVLTMDYSCNIDGVISAENGFLDIASIIHQTYGKWFRGVRASEIVIGSPNFTAQFNVHTFGMKTHVDNTWTLGSWAVVNATDLNVSAIRLYQHFLTHGTPDESDDTMDSEYYAIIDAILSGTANASIVSDWFPDERHSVWWGNETIAFAFEADDISSFINVEEFPEVHLYMDVGMLSGELIRPR